MGMSLAHACYDKHWEVKEQVVGVRFLLQICGSWQSNSGQTRWQMPLTH